MVVWSIVSFDAEERAAKGSNPCRYYESRVLEVKSDGQKNQDHSWLLTVSASTCHSRDHLASPHLKRTLSPSCLTGSKKIWFILSVTCNRRRILLSVKSLVLTRLELLIEMGWEDVEKKWTTREDEIAIRTMYCLFSDCQKMEYEKYRNYRQQKRYKLKWISLRRTERRIIVF